MSALEEIFARFTTEFDDSALQKGDESTSTLMGSLRQLGTLLAGGAIAAGAKRFISTSAAIGDELDKTSRVIGIDTQALQSWRHAANLSGVSSGSFTQGLIKLQRTMGDAQRGTATALEPFRDLGVAFEDSAGQLRPVEDVLLDLADPLSNMESSSERVAILSTLMGRAGARVGPLFEQGAAGVAAMRQELEDLGGGASPEMIQAAAELTDANARMDLAFLGLRSRIATGLLPVVQRGVEGFTKMVVAVGRLWENSKILQAALAVLGGVAAVAAAKIVIGFAPAILSFALMAAAAAGVLLVVEDFLVALEGGDSVLGNFSEGIYEWIAANEGISGVADAWGQLLAVVEEVYSYFGGDTPNPEEFTTQRGLGSPEQGFRTNQAAEAQAQANTDALGGNRFAQARNRVVNRQTIARLEYASGDRAVSPLVGGPPPESEFTDQRGLPGARVFAPSPVREGAAAQRAAAQAAPVVVNQENVTNINGLGLDERGVRRVLTDVQRTEAAQLQEALTGGVGEE